DDLRPPGARRRDGPARQPLLAPRPALVRLLRPAPDRPADVAGDRRPVGCALLTRLWIDLFLPERADDRVADGRPIDLPVEPRPARDTAPVARDVDRPGPAGDCIRRTHLPGDRRAGGGDRPAERDRLAGRRRTYSLRERQFRIPPRPTRGRERKSRRPRRADN